MLGRDVKEPGALEEGPQASPEIVESLSPMGFFNHGDLSPSRKFLSLSHKQQNKELEWKPVQTAGIAIGLILILLL